MTHSITAAHDALGWLDDELESLDSDELLRSQRTVIPRPHGRCEVEGRELINFATNDYLGLAADIRLREAARAAIEETGTGARASSLIVGRTPWHQRLEQQIAHFEGTEAALLFPTGFAANIGTIAALVGPGDVVCGDRLNHASLIDGSRLSGATFRVYPHADADRLDHELGKHRDVRRRLIVTDGLFSMDGDIAPLAQLCDVAERHQAMLLVDEAHATGVLGAKGRGAIEAAGVEDRVTIRIGTLSKSLGSQGGFVAGSQALIDWLFNRARSQIYSTALCPPACAAAGAALEIIDAEPERRVYLNSLGDQLRQKLSEAGFQFAAQSVGPIVPVIIGEAAVAREVAATLEGRGLLVPAIRPPSVPRGSSRLRISLCCEHTEADVSQLVRALAELNVGLV